MCQIRVSTVFNYNNNIRTMTEELQGKMRKSYKKKLNNVRKLQSDLNE
jgi:hypothetical protein